MGLEHFHDVSLVIILAAGFGLVAHLFRQPTILGYLVAGLVVGPLGIFEVDAEILTLFAEIGIALLLFMIGLELNVSELKHIGKPALFTGVGQIVFTFGVGLLLVKLLGFATVPAIFMSMALTFSSTIIVVKLLHEKNDLDSLYGKIVIGFLLVQDVVAIFGLVFVAGWEESTTLIGTLGQFGWLLIKGVVVVGLVFYAGKRFFPWILDRIGRSQEMLFIFSIAWGLGFATFMSWDLIGYSIEMGGLLAGLALANSSEHFQISSKIRPLRDFFILMFFVVLGYEMILADLAEIFVPAILLSLFVLVGNPLIVIIIMTRLGYRIRTSFLASLTVAQISEFSLIVMLAGQRQDLGVAAEHTSIITFVAVVTILGSSYMIWHGNELYARFGKYLSFLERKTKDAEHIGEVVDLKGHIVLVGAHRTGSVIINALQEIDADFVCVDFNPMVVRKLKQQNIPVIYGDIVDAEIQERAGIHNAQLIISTVPDIFDASTLLKAVKRVNSDAQVIVTAESDWAGLQLYKEGADYVLLPHFLGGRQLASIIKEDSDFENLHKYKLRDMHLIREDVA